VLRVENLSIRYYDHKEFAIKDVSFREDRGLILFAGKTGSGKSTLARALSGLIPHVYPAEVKGSISIFGVNPIKSGPLSLKGIVGYLSQNIELFSFSSTVSEELLIPLLNVIGDLKEAKRRVREVLNAFRIGNLADKRISEISSGQRQLVMLASTLVLDPKVLILDEPLARLDRKNAIFIASMLKDISKERLVIVFEHHLDELLCLSDKVYVIDKKILASGKPKDVINFLTGVDIPLITEAFICAKCDEVPLSCEEAADIVRAKGYLV